MRKSFFVLISFFIGIFVFLGSMTSFAQMAQPDQQEGQPGRDLNQQQPGPGPQSDEGMGTAPEESKMIPTRGKVSGEVIDVDPPTGLIEIRTDQGLTNIFTVEGDAKKQLDQVKKGDQVDLVVVLNAVEVTPQGLPGGPTEQTPSG